MNMHRPPLLLALAAICALASCATPSDRQLYLQADTNHDGRLSLAEVNAVGMPRVFAHFDTDGDGSVTLVEAREVEPEFPAQEFNQRDLNHDGKVSYSEYEIVAKSHGGLKKLFAKVDTNGDGFIDKAEADAYVDKLEAQSVANR